MATETIKGGFGELRAASTAAGGTALSATAAFIQLPLVTSQITLMPRNFSTAVVAKFAINPWLVVLKTTDNMVTAPTDYSESAQDASASTDVVVTGLDTLANGDFFLVGSHLPFRGTYIDVDSANDAGTATMVVYYWNGSAWADSSATVTGIRTTRIFDKDGLLYWTVPTDWKAATLKELYPLTPASTYTGKNFFWTRWSVDAALAATSITLNSIVSANRSTTYAELVTGQEFEEHISHGLGGVGCIEALTDAGTANLIVNVATHRDGKFK